MPSAISVPVVVSTWDTDCVPIGSIDVTAVCPPIRRCPTNANRFRATTGGISIRCSNARPVSRPGVSLTRATFHDTNVFLVNEIADTASVTPTLWEASPRFGVWLSPQPLMALFNLVHRSRIAPVYQRYRVPCRTASVLWGARCPYTSRRRSFCGCTCGGSFPSSSRYSTLWAPPR